MAERKYLDGKMIMAGPVHLADGTVKVQVQMTPGKRDWIHFACMDDYLARVERRFTGPLPDEVPPEEPKEN